jgi:hypothetical protein
MAGFISAHPLHISYTNVEINGEEKIVTVSHKFYTDDFSLLFYHLYEKEIEPKNDMPFDPHETKLISSYVRQRFSLLSDNDTIALSFSRKDQDEESLWLHFSGSLNPENVKNLTIENLLLFDLFMDQTNLLIVTQGKKEKGFSFDYENRRWVLSLHE